MPNLEGARFARRTRVLATTQEPEVALDRLPLNRTGSVCRVAAGNWQPPLRSGFRHSTELAIGDDADPICHQTAPDDSPFPDSWRISEKYWYVSLRSNCRGASPKPRSDCGSG